MLESGFFNAVDGDRVYAADTFNTFFEGIISANGVFEGVDDCFNVTASEGMNVNVGSGKAMVNHHWVRNDAIETLAIEAAHASLTRYDMVVLRWSSLDRTITLNVTKGTAASTPTKPTPERNESICEIAIAYIKVSPAVTELTNADIVDCKHDDDVCGVVASLIDRVDVSGIYRRYLAEYEALTQKMETWFEQQKANYTKWFESMTETLLVNTEIKRTVANYIANDNARNIELPERLDYENGDIVDVIIGGVLLIEGTDYELAEIEDGTMEIKLYNDVEVGTVITFYCLKSVVGDVPAGLDSIIELQETLIEGDVE